MQVEWYGQSAFALRAPRATVFVDLFGDMSGLAACGMRFEYEQAAAIGRVDLALLPVGGGPTMDGRLAAAIARRIEATRVVPMHYRTHRTDFLGPADVLLDELGEVRGTGASSFDAALPDGAGPVAVVLDAP